MDKQEEDRLKNLFGKVNLDEPSENFEDKLMWQIHKKAKRRIERNVISSKFYTWLAMVGGVATIILVPAAIFYIFAWPMPLESVKISFAAIRLEPHIISVFLIILSLAIADTLIRKFISNKRSKD